jgi:hypothetical protein
MLSWLGQELKLLHVPNLLVEVFWTAPLLQNLSFGLQHVLSTFSIYFLVAQLVDLQWVVIVGELQKKLIYY